MWKFKMLTVIKETPRLSAVEFCLLCATLCSYGYFFIPFYSFLCLYMLINPMINYECWVFATEPEPRTMKRLCLGTVISVQNDTCNAEVTIKQQIILIKQAFPIVPTDKRHEKLGCTPFYSKHLHRICHSFVTVSSRPIYTQSAEKTGNKAHWNSSGMLPLRQVDVSACRRLFGGCGLCGQRHDDVCTPAMAPGLRSHSWNSGGKRGKGRKGWDGMAVVKGGGKRLQGQCWGGGEEGAKEPESCIHY